MRNTYPVSHVVTDSEQWRALTPAAKVLYVTLCKLSDLFKNEKGWFFRSDRLLMDDSGLSQTAISKSKKQLIDNRFIQMITTKDHSRRKATRYKIRPP